MNKPIDTVQKIRLFLLDAVKDLSAIELNEVPAGFNNNIIWNLAHLVAAQQGICYLRSGVHPVVDEKYLIPYRPGEFIDEDEIDIIKSLLLSSLEQLETNVNANLFVNYTPWTTRYGVELSNIDEALEFLPFHEGYHAGCITALKRLVHK